MPAPDTQLPAHTSPPLRERWTPLLWFLSVSALYFADTLLRASIKRFWFDELYTVYLCRLPTIDATWQAVRHGCDFNPPILYILTRASERLFGEGLIGTRLPEILGFWVFGICLYVFVARRLGRLRGAIAAMLPVFTLAHVYAYEARAHGILLAWCGLMLVCWQRSIDEPARRWRWAFAFFLSFLGALLTHVYAIYLTIPFLLVELFFIRRRRIRAGITAILLITPLVVLAWYVPMAKAYATMNPGSGLQTHFANAIHEMLVGMYGPTLLLLIIALGLIAWRASSQDRQIPGRNTEQASLSHDELVLAVGFLLLPIVGVIGVRISKGPLFDRYFLSTVAGLSLVVAQATTLPKGSRAVARGLFASLLILLLGDCVIVGRAYTGSAAMDLIEPASKFQFSSDRRDPLARDAALRADTSGLDVLVPQNHNYLYLAYYAPPGIRDRLTYGAPNADDLILVSNRLLAHWTGADLHTATFDEFFARHNDFLVYSSTSGMFNNQCSDCLEVFLKAGYTLRSVQPDAGNLLEHFSR